MQRVYLGTIDDLDCDSQESLEKNLSHFDKCLGESKSSATFVVCDLLPYAIGTFSPKQVICLAYGPVERGLYFRTGDRRVHLLVMDHVENSLPLQRDTTFIITRTLEKQGIHLLPTLYYNLCQEYQKQKEQIVLNL